MALSKLIAPWNIALKPVECKEVKTGESAAEIWMLSQFANMNSNFHHALVPHCFTSVIFNLSVPLQNWKVGKLLPFILISYTPGAPYV
ncbi:hypothetical protein D3C87_1517430 [compost metagenome]